MVVQSKILAAHLWQPLILTVAGLQLVMLAMQLRGMVPILGHFRQRTASGAVLGLTATSLTARQHEQLSAIIASAQTHRARGVFQLYSLTSSIPNRRQHHHHHKSRLKQSTGQPQKHSSRCSSPFAVRTTVAGSCTEMDPDNRCGKDTCKCGLTQV
jgi:hypothetical protein